jgi:hypothetical protein
MRKTLLVGLSLAAAAIVAVLVSGAFDLELESVALMGAAMGAVVALVPDRTPLSRLAGFGAGFLVAWVGYAVRASALPDSVGGKAVAVAFVVLAVTAIVLVTRERLALWSTLLGAGTFAGAYELTYVAAPPEMLSTSMSTATTLLINLALGFLAAAAFAPTTRTRSATIAPTTEMPAQRDEIPADLTSLNLENVR